MGTSRPVLWLEEEQISKGQRPAGSGGGEVVVMGVWCWLYSCVGRATFFLPSCPHPPLPVQVTEQEPAWVSTWQARPLGYVQIFLK